MPVDGNAGATGQVTVTESGLTSVGDTGETTTGSITLAAADGLTSITVGGTTVTRAQLAALGTTPVVIDTGEGTLTLTGYTSTSDVGGITTGGTLAYSYTLKANLSQPGATESSDSIALTILDEGAGTSSGNLIVGIIDDTPTANADVNAVSEGTTAGATSTTGNVFSGSSPDVADRLGADTSATPVTAVAFGGNAQTVGTAFNSIYGSLTLNANGSYTYTLDNTNPTVNALKAGGVLSEVFNYTITDSDGDASSTTLTITINGANDGPTATDDTNVVTEDSATNTVTGNVKPDSVSAGNHLDTDPDNTNDELSVTGIRTGEESATTGTAGSPGSSLTGTYGTLTLNTDGSYSYSLDNTNPVVNALTPASAPLTDVFTYTLSDGHLTDTAALTITISGANDAATALDDNFSVSGDTALVGTLTGNDISSGDGGNVWSLGAGASNGTAVVNADGTFTYTPNANFIGTDNFTYSITDANGDVSTATVSVTVTAPTPAPTPLDPPPESLVTPPLPVIARPQAQLNTTFAGDQAREPSVFFDGATFSHVIRLPIPMHPVVYVNRAVDLAQRERQATDALNFSSPGQVDNSDSADGRIFNQIGFDPNLFVQNAVRASQVDSRFLSNTVSGRLDRLSLSSDRLLLTPGLFLMDTEFQTVQQQMELDALRQAQASQPAGVATPSLTESPPGDLARPQERPLIEAQRAQEILPGADNPHRADSAALSFTAQLKKGSSRLPLTSRAAQSPATV